MKWFKHFSNASEDEFIQRLEDEFGLAGYAWWWKILETVARNSKPGECSATLSSSKWKSSLLTNSKGLNKCLDFLELAGKSSISRHPGNRELITISIPKLLEIHDEWTSKVRRKSGHNSGVTPDQEVEVEVEVDKNKDKEEEKGINPTYPQEEEKFILPNWVPVDLWNDFLVIRKKKGAKDTPRALKILLAKLTGIRDKGENPQDVLERAIVNSWKSVYPSKDQSPPPRKHLGPYAEYVAPSKEPK